MLRGATAGLLLPFVVVAVVLADAIPSGAFVFGTQIASALHRSIHDQNHRSNPARHWNQPPPRNTSCSTTSSKTTTRHFALPPDYQEQGNQIIREAARRVGVVPDELLAIEWKPGCIICTVSGNDAYLSAPLEDGLRLEEEEEDNVVSDDLLFLEEEDDGDSDDELPFDDEDDGEDDKEDTSTDAATPAIETDDTNNNSSNGRIDMAVLARAINAALDENGMVGLQIAETHEIQVTTAGASDEVRGDIMFRAYRGFDVMVQYQDPKRGDSKIKTVQGRLVERNDEFTVINIQGRMKNFKNLNILSVRLPKAKKEKGAR